MPRGARPPNIAIADAYRSVLIDDIPRFKPDEKNPVKRFAILIDTLYERKVKLLASAAGAPQDLHRGTHIAMEFQRTVSRLMEMQSQEYLEMRQDTERARLNAQDRAVGGGMTG